MNADVLKTKEYYASDKAEPCDCAYCRNYCKRIKATRPKLAAHLAEMGVDIKKPFELFFIENEAEHTVLYCNCMYIVYGTCEKDLDYRFDGLWFTNNIDCHPYTDIPEAHFVLDFGELTLEMEEE